ncbi:DUF3426 domain-containing protein [Litorimonas sp. RW-G-Af-16]|uniref:DUF3426 domain-containing protein n=1 Tax=Litorimonas sp. RW-G-Af-16 TaxID=3241168 RepID=UPI00390C9FEA
MILTCPECSTKYLTKADSIGPNGRTVRCAKCSETWFVSAEEALEVTAQITADQRALDEDLTSSLTEEAPVDVAPLTPVPNMGGAASGTTAPGAHVLLRDKADAEKRARRRRVIWAIWLIPLLILMTAAILAYIFRQDIVERFPASATIYQSLGIPVTTAGLEIENPTARTAIIDGQTVLVISSAITNISNDSVRVPAVQLTLRNGAGEAVAEWFVEPKSQMLAPKARLEFASQYPDPPVDAVKLHYDFASESGL